MVLHIEIFRHGMWQTAAVFTPEQAELGYRGAGRLDYLLDYAAEHINDAGAVLSNRYPVSFAAHRRERWPAFLLDLLPSGAGRRAWVERLGLADDFRADYALLENGAANPPGNLRIKESADKRRTQLLPDAGGELRNAERHQGFTKEDILERQEYFIEYAHQHGAHVAGATDIQGEAPKYLLQQDDNGRWHVEGALSDSRVAKHWIVKFPRGRTERDRKVLANEASYLEVARACGLNVGGRLDYSNHALFIPRFDRQVCAGGVERIGMESLCSLAGVAEYGARLWQETLSGALLGFIEKQNRQQQIVEYIKRDILNVVLGNKDNHARNTAILRDDKGQIKLSPLFDFAPMFLDPEGIARAVRWKEEREQGGQPVWAKVAEHFDAWCDVSQLKQELKMFAGRVEALPETMRDKGVDDDVTEHRMRSIETNQHLLEDC